MSRVLLLILSLLLVETSWARLPTDEEISAAVRESPQAFRLYLARLRGNPEHFEYVLWGLKNRMDNIMFTNEYAVVSQVEWPESLPTSQPELVQWYVTKSDDFTLLARVLASYGLSYISRIDDSSVRGRVEEYISKYIDRRIEVAKVEWDKRDDFKKENLNQPHDELGFILVNSFGDRYSKVGIEDWLYDLLDKFIDEHKEFLSFSYSSVATRRGTQTKNPYGAYFAHRINEGVDDDKMDFFVRIICKLKHWEWFGGQINSSNYSARFQYLRSVIKYFHSNMESAPDFATLYKFINVQMAQYYPTEAGYLLLYAISESEYHDQFTKHDAKSSLFKQGNGDVNALLEMHRSSRYGTSDALEELRQRVLEGKNSAATRGDEHYWGGFRLTQSPPVVDPPHYEPFLPPVEFEDPFPLPEFPEYGPFRYFDEPEPKKGPKPKPPPDSTSEVLLPPADLPLPLDEPPLKPVAVHIDSPPPIDKPAPIDADPVARGGPDSGCRKKRYAIAGAVVIGTPTVVVVGVVGLRWAFSKKEPAAAPPKPDTPATPPISPPVVPSTEAPADPTYAFLRSRITFDGVRIDELVAREMQQLNDEGRAQIMNGTNKEWFARTLNIKLYGALEDRMNPDRRSASEFFAKPQGTALEKGFIHFELLKKVYARNPSVAKRLELRIGSLNDHGIATMKTHVAQRGDGTEAALPKTIAWVVLDDKTAYCPSTKFEGDAATFEQDFILKDHSKVISKYSIE